MHAFLKTGTLSSGSKEKHDGQAAGSSKESKKSKKPVPWVEKYRPKSVDDVAYQDEVVAVLKKSLQGCDLPNLLFYGPPGTGKTSTILAASRELFGDIYKTRVLELNASDERGIDVIRQKVKTFSQQSASGITPDGKPCPPFKIVILDEADSMTGAAQAALRRTMEKESKSTRFCLICNYVSRIIEPIASRCAKFRFRPLAKDILKKRLRYICDEEKISCEDEALTGLLYTSEGDLRKAITYLQSASRLKGEETITKADIYEIAGVIADDVIDGLITVCHSNSYEKLQAYVEDLMNDGHAASQLILQLHDKVVCRDDLDDKQKSTVLEKLAYVQNGCTTLLVLWWLLSNVMGKNFTDELKSGKVLYLLCTQLNVVDKCLMDGADEFLQLMALCSTMMQQICQPKK